tara:strand:+ start:3330 stop:4268 length:939 start_codon:yes stop_codon:yes gene_type:complete
MGSIIRNLITGGAGFLGSHLVDRLMNSGEKVICLDNYCSGRKNNVIKWISNSRFELIDHDVTIPIHIEADRIWHLACPAAPSSYLNNPIKTSKTNFLGTYNMLELAKNIKAKLLMASTSEVYGNPEIHPQPESYKGSVNNIGLRSCYDEGKRIAESLCFDFNRIYSNEITIARIFNTYGPRMLPEDGRVISNFIVQSLNNEPITIYGDGSQTRSFCYVDDLIEALILLMNSRNKGPINLGNPYECSILELAELIRSKINPEIPLINQKLPQDDPLKRQPVIDIAKQELEWEPKISLAKGLDKTINYFRNKKG